MTLDERTDKSAPAVVNFDDTQGKERYTFRAIKTQRTLQKLDYKCEIKGLRLNEKKTQLLSISAGRAATRLWTTSNDGGTIYSSHDCKILGFIFSNKPNPELQIQNLIRRANARTFVLRYYSKFMEGNDLTKLYSALIRSVLEYSSVTYGPMLSKAQSNRLEQVQKNCLTGLVINS